jgi:hypothetical protein
MKKVFYSIAVLMAVAWITSFFILGASGASVHIFLFLAAICWLHATILVPQKKYMLDGNIRSTTEEVTEEQRA